MPDQDQTPPTQAPVKPGEPYCGACGHRLTGLTDSARCPECGRPIVEVLTRSGGRMGSRYRSPATLFGLPVIDVAFGATHEEARGRARGILAFGDQASGLLACGGSAFGIVAIGGRAIGVFAVGGLALGLISAWGGVALAAIAYGGVAIGLLAYGGLGIGLVAGGGMALGLYAQGGAPIAAHALGPGASSPEARSVFTSLRWFFGPPAFSLWNFIQPLLIVIGLPLVMSIACGLLAVFGHVKSGSPEQ